jgi:calcium-dependent protein kinase
MQVLKGADVWSLGVIFFMMLSGHPPFDGEDENEIYDSVMIGEYTWNPMIRVSDQAKDLVSKMLTVDHTKRITAAEALNHPWIANHESNSDVSLNDALKALKDFSTASLIKKAVANILIKEMTEEDTAKLKQLFDELDTDGDRALDLDELTLYMKHHGHAEDADAEAAAKAFLEAADESKVLLHQSNFQEPSFPNIDVVFVFQRGTINFLEFESAHMRGQLGKDAVAIRKAFDAIDADKSGSIGHEKVKALLGEENAKAFAELFSHSGVALERTITFQDFFKAMTSGSFHFHCDLTRITCHLFFYS